jgi:hypothetical protein
MTEDLQISPRNIADCPAYDCFHGNKIDKIFVRKVRIVLKNILEHAILKSRTKGFYVSGEIKCLLGKLLTLKSLNL